MHRSCRIDPRADSDKFGAHQLHIVTVARQQMDGAVQRPQVFGNKAIAVPPSVVYQISGDNKHIRAERFQPTYRSLQRPQRRKVWPRMDIGNLRNEHVLPPRPCRRHYAETDSIGLPA
jgi:hypothetical protein